MRVVVVGAGVSGLLAARQLSTAGHSVVVLDKGRGVGGRLATRRIAGARVDHGAQFFTVRSDTFGALVDQWQRAGLVREWCRGFVGAGDGYPRYVVNGGMTALAKHVATGLDVRCSTMAFAVRRGDGSAWDVQSDDGGHYLADGLVVSCPVPQAAGLLATADVDVPESLRRMEYDRTLALLAVLDGPSAVAPPGGVQGAPGFTFIADNAMKGISEVPALTMHADPVWSEAHWDDPPDDAHAALRALAAPWLGRARIVRSELKRWRFATPRTPWPDECWSPDDPGAPLALAGDAFAGPRVEGAALSGLAAAARLDGRF